MIRASALLTAAIAAVIMAASIVGLLNLAPEIPRLPDDLRILGSSPATEIYGAGGELIGRLGGREYVSFDNISPYFINAVIAAEDRRFYRHHGIDHLAVLRALWQNLTLRENAPGGSTITQQLAKNLFFTFERSWRRKLLEGLAALALEDRFSKREILEAYCNLVYFGRYAYGIERAAQIHFGAHASELKLHEAALLAGLPNSPSRFNPYIRPDLARARQRTILTRMANAGMIDTGAIDSLIATPIKLVAGKVEFERGSYPVDHIIERAGEIMGEDLVRYGGLRITSTIDYDLQRAAERILAAGVQALEVKLKPPPGESPPSLQGALAALDVASGQILAEVGGRSYTDSPYNRAVSARRQPGSAFKPVVYLAALERTEFSPATVLVDSALTLPIDRRRDWKPQNFDMTYQGSVTLKYALMRSINTIAAQLAYRVTPERVVNTAKRLGATTPLDPHLSLALGSQGLSTIEMAAIIASIAREGVVITPHIIARIEGRGGEVLFENFPVGERRFAAETAYQLIDMMEGVIDGGTGRIVRLRGFRAPAIGKTGTSSDFRDSWFVGATPTMAAAVWTGYDDNREMRLESGLGVTGASGAAPLWADFMIYATAGQPSREFPRPPAVEKLFLEPRSGLVSRSDSAGWISVVLTGEEIQRMGLISNEK